MSTLHADLQVVNFQRYKYAFAHPICKLAHVSGVLFKYCTVRLKMFSLFFVCLFFMYYFCEKYYKSITVQYYIADCVSWIPRLTLLDLGTNWIYERALGMELIRM